jgi:hypothetical protein
MYPECKYEGKVLQSLINQGFPGFDLGKQEIVLISNGILSASTEAEMQGYKNNKKQDES